MKHARLLAVLAIAAAGPVPAAGVAPAPESSDYVYRTQLHDTLIGISRRLLKSPARWHEVQTRNKIAHPTRMPLATALRIPRDWLRQTSEAAAALSVVGLAARDGAPIKRGDVLAEGAQLTTTAASHLTLQLADGSLVTLRPSSTLTLQTLKRYSGTGLHDTLLKLDSGTVETKVKPQGEAGRFQIRTPVAVSAVRGTEFRRSLGTDALDRTEVMGGTVAVSATDVGATHKVEVPSGFGTLSDAAGGPRAPVKLLPPPDLSALPGDWIESELRVDFPTVAGAQRYRAQLATDPDFHDVLEESEAVSPPLSLATAPDGDYWLRVRSVDELGLAGADAVRRVHRHRLPDAPRLQDPTADGFTSGVDAVFRWDAPADSASYRLQLSQDAGFERVSAEYAGSEPQCRRAILAGAYYWRVAALNSAGETGRWSEVRRFTQKPPPTDIAQASLEQHLLQLSWDGKPGQQFRVQVARDARFQQLVTEVATAEPRTSVPHLGPGTYFARVQRIDADGYVAPWSQARRVVVPLPWWVKASPVLLVLPFL